MGMVLWAVPAAHGPAYGGWTVRAGGSGAPAAAPGAGRQSAAPHPAVARIIVPERGGTSYGSGTLVDVDGDYGLVVTNWHVVRGAAGVVRVVFSDGFRSAAKVVRADREWDLAALAIWKPNSVPVDLATEPPRPGEWLTIAGYGAGPYRAVSGRCTQYVAPGMHSPFEMVELAATAREGDSGGPIFNSRGELAGVLFGEGHGRTSGSYCGRVRRFLSAVIPAAQDTDVPAIASVPEQEPSRPSVPRYEHPGTQAERLSPTGDAAPEPFDRPVQVRNEAGSQPATRGAVEAAHPHWTRWAGDTPLEQIKTALAAVGALALAAHALRRLTGARSR